MNNYIIVADGAFLPKKMIEEASRGRVMIALDGAADRLMQMGIRPDIILGDLDSIQAVEAYGIRATFAALKEKEMPYEGHQGVLIVPIKNQALTDLDKAIQYCDAQTAASITIICATGGRLDHHENALRLLRVYDDPRRPLLLHTEHETVRFAKNEQVVITGQMGDKCAIMAFPEAIFTSWGLVYEGRYSELKFGFQESISNALSMPRAEVSIIGEALIMMPLQLAS